MANQCDNLPGLLAKARALSAYIAQAGLRDNKLVGHCAGLDIELHKPPFLTMVDDKEAPDARQRPEV